MPQKVEALLARAKKAAQETDTNRSMYEDAYEYINPFKNVFNNTEGAGQSHNTPTKQYDSTAMINAKNFVDTMQSNFTPVFSRWAEFRAGPGVPEEQRDEYNKVMQKVTEKVFAYLNASNFATESAEMYYDLGMGTGCMFILEGDESQPLNFVAAASSQFDLEEGKFGKVSGIFKRTSIRPGDIEHRWKGAKLDTRLNELKKDKPNEKIELMEAVYYDEGEMVWYHDVIFQETGHRLYSKEHLEDVVVTPRWMKIPGYARGIGPFIMALADIKTLNKLKELTLKLAALNAFGVYTYERKGGLNPNTASIYPGAFIPVESNGGATGQTVRELPRAGDFNVQQVMVNDLQDQIRQVMMDNRLPPESGPVRTAFEISQRISELQQDIGASFGRLMYEYVQPLFRRILAILKKKGLVELPKDFDLDNFFTVVQVVSPIARQQQMQDVQNFMQAFSMVQGVDPQLALLAYEVEKLPGWLVEKLGADAGLLREDADKEQMTQAIIQLAQQQQQVQNGGQAPQTGAPAQ